MQIIRYLDSTQQEKYAAIQADENEVDYECELAAAIGTLSKPVVEAAGS